MRMTETIQGHEITFDDVGGWLSVSSPGGDLSWSYSLHDVRRDSVEAGHGGDIRDIAAVRGVVLRMVLANRLRWRLRLEAAKYISPLKDHQRSQLKIIKAARRALNVFRDREKAANKAYQDTFFGSPVEREEVAA